VNKVDGTQILRPTKNIQCTIFRAALFFDWITWRQNRKITIKLWNEICCVL